VCGGDFTSARVAARVVQRRVRLVAAAPGTSSSASTSSTSFTSTSSASGAAAGATDFDAAVAGLYKLNPVDP
jgi:hypothetical protein